MNKNNKLDISVPTSPRIAYQGPVVQTWKDDTVRTNDAINPYGVARSISNYVSTLNTYRGSNVPR